MEVQNQMDFHAMAAELEKKKVEFEDRQRLEVEKYQKVLCASQADKMANDTKWAAWAQQLQVDQATKQKEVADDFAHRIAELQQQ